MALVKVWTTIRDSNSKHSSATLHTLRWFSCTHVHININKNIFICRIMHTYRMIFLLLLFALLRLFLTFQFWFWCFSLASKYHIVLLSFNAVLFPTHTRTHTQAIVFGIDFGIYRRLFFSGWILFFPLAVVSFWQHICFALIKFGVQNEYFICARYCCCRCRWLSTA